MKRSFLYKFICVMVAFTLIVPVFAETAFSAETEGSAAAESTITVTKPKLKAKLTQTSYTYTGSKITPKFKVMLSDGTVADKKLYKVSYSTSRKYVGSHKVTITPTAACASQKKIVLTFKIIPKSTSITGVTKGLRKMTVKWNKRTTQNSGYQIKYYRKSNESSARYKTISSNSTTKTTLYNFITDRTYTFKVRCWKKVDGVKYYSKWSSGKNYRTLDSSVSLPNADTKLKSTRHRDNGSNLILVNKKYAVSEEFYPKDMVTVSTKYATKSGIKIKSSAYSAYKKMTSAAKKDGKYFYITSGYRSYTYQENLYASYLKSYGKTYTNKISAYPGRSEHHTGLAIDVTSASAGWTLSTNFSNTAEGKWIKKNAHKYGFIVRYGKNKTSITGYSYEPWHLRYVGKEAATKIYNRGITLEEYLGKA